MKSYIEFGAPLKLSSLSIISLESNTDIVKKAGVIIHTINPLNPIFV